jgi:poly(3-hydroxybutyrate) depolymerase
VDRSNSYAACAGTEQETLEADVFCSWCGTAIVMAALVGCSTSPTVGQPTSPSTSIVGESVPASDGPTNHTSVATVAPVTDPPATTFPTTTSLTLPTTEATAALPTATHTNCSAASGQLTTTSGRHVILRAAGLTGPSPTIFVIHGYTGTPTGVEKVAEITGAANAAGAAVAYPEGAPTKQGGFGWSTGAGIFATEDVDDVAALGEMIDAVIATGCVDATRMTLTGESNGGGMTLVALCSPELADRFQQFVLVNPAIDPAVLAHCEPGTAPQAITVEAGLLDRTVPYLGGRPPLLAQLDWFSQFASATNLCGGVSEPVPVDAHVVEIAGEGCAACTQLVVVDDGTHTWPGTSRGYGSLTPGTFDLNTRLIDRVLSDVPGCIVGT